MTDIMFYYIMSYMIYMYILIDAVCAVFVCCIEMLHLYKNHVVKKKNPEDLNRF